MTELTYAQRNELAQELGKIVSRYFSDTNYGRCEPVVTFFEYNLRHYTFKMSSQTRGTSASYVLRYEKRNDLSSFKKEIKDCLKSHGFTNVKVDVKSRKCTYDWGGTYRTDTEKALIGVYFDW